MKTIARIFPGPPAFNYTANIVGTTKNDVSVEVDVHLETLGINTAKAVLLLVNIFQQRLSDLFKWVPMPFTCSIMRAHGAGAEHFGWDSMIFVGRPPLTSQDQVGPAAHNIAALWVCEAVELYTHADGKGWEAGTSHGEALSRFIGESYYPGALTESGIQSVAGWLNAPGRPDWISKTNPDETTAVPIGCAMAFLHYLKDVVGKPLGDIVKAPGATLEQKYEHLTGKHGGYAAMMAVVNKKFPTNAKVSNILPMDSPFLFH